MEKTTNYQLKKWDKQDRILMQDFNDNSDAIDAALAAQVSALAAEAAARKDAVAAEAAARAAAVAALSSRCRIVAGSYAGTGGASVSIACGFQPKLFFVGVDHRAGMSLAGPYSGAFGASFQLYMEGVSAIYTYKGGSTGGMTTYTPNANGISWSNSASDSADEMAMNSSGYTYHWVALG